MTERELAEALHAALKKSAEESGDHYYLYPRSETDGKLIFTYDGEIDAEKIARAILNHAPNP